MKWKRVAEEERVVWTSEPFAIVRGLSRHGRKYRVWYQLAFVGQFPTLKEAKARIENHLEEFASEGE